MGFKDVNSLECDTAIQIGGVDKKTGKKSPTSIEGYFLGGRDIPSKFSSTGKAKLWVFNTDKGNVGVYGKTDMNKKLEAVVPGTMTRVTHAGSVPTRKGNDMIKYRVEVDADNTMDVSGLNQAAAEYDGGEVSGEGEEYEEDTSLDAAEPALDETPPARATAPRTPAPTPDKNRQAQVQALLNRGKKTA